MPDSNLQALSSILNDYDNGTSYNVCAKAARIFQTLKKNNWTSAPTPLSNISIYVEPTLPPLAWLCEIENNNGSFFIGSGVEQGKNFIVEGVWDGNFNKGNFIQSDHFYGSGAFINKDNICIFSPPRHCTDFLFVLRDKQKSKTFISNSFCFILNRAGIKQDSNFYQIFKKSLNSTSNQESAFGADRGSPRIAEDESFAIYRMMYHNFTVDPDGKINYLMRLPQKLYINTFEDYRTFLLHTTKQIITNGSASSRKKSLPPITMLSTGYDSCAVSTICSLADVKKAVTLDVSTYGNNDCGCGIATILGLDCYKAESPLGKNIPTLNASLGEGCEELLEFFATAGIGDNLAFLGMEKYITGHIVFSGMYGDGCWSACGNGSGLAHHLPYMKSRNEFRLRTGYCMVPMPAFGAYFPYALKKAAASKGMENYSIGGKYDRPIPRRIAEEAGVPRLLFGQVKVANNPNIMNYKEFFDTALNLVSQRYNIRDKR